MQAIETKHMPATQSRGSRIKASCERGAVTVSWSYDLNEEMNHIMAAHALVARFLKEDEAKNGSPIDRNPWNKLMATGALKNSYVHVFVG